jgi:hypothetical protein
VETSNLKGNSEPDKDIEIGILATAKKMGLSFEELNLFSLNDYLVFVDKWTGEESDTVRQATQADIDFFMG